MTRYGTSPRCAPSRRRTGDSPTAVARLEALEAALRGIARPLNADEAALLIDAFGPDSCFGLAWPLLHLIETAPPLPLPMPHANPWVCRMWRRQQNAAAAP